MGIAFGKDSSNPNEEKAGVASFELDRAGSDLYRAAGNLLIAEEKFRQSGQIKHENITRQLRVKLEKIEADIVRIPTLAYLL